MNRPLYIDMGVVFGPSKSDDPSLNLGRSTPPSNKLGLINMGQHDLLWSPSHFCELSRGLVRSLH